MRKRERGKKRGEYKEEEREIKRERGKKRQNTHTRKPLREMSTFFERGNSQQNIIIRFSERFIP